jgi:hypothetical protein
MLHLRYLYIKAVTIPTKKSAVGVKGLNCFAVKRKCPPIYQVV